MLGLCLLEAAVVHPGQAGVLNARQRDENVPPGALTGRVSR
jgi:hypothetical protein